ncbi:hypothetical protein LXL04_002766 [Taraxacum kok-saghyz]
MEEATPSDDVHMHFKGSYLKEESTNDHEKAFVDDKDLDDCDVDEQLRSQHLKVPFDVFLYNFSHVLIYKEKESVDGESIREEGSFNNERTMENSSDDHGDKEYGVHDPSIGERYATQDEL